DHLPAVCTLDEERLPGPLGPFAIVPSLEDGDRDLLGGLRTLRVVPDEELSVAHHRGPGARLGGHRHALGVRDARALAVSAPTPVVERARDGVALDGALGEVAAHVSAVAVEDLHPVGGAEDHEAGTEDLDHVGLAVIEVLGQAEAVPSAGEAARVAAALDLANRGVSVCGGHQGLPSWL